MTKSTTVYDKDGLIHMILTWHLEQGDAMLQNFGPWKQFFPDSTSNNATTHLWNVVPNYLPDVQNLPKKLLPLLVAMARGKDTSYLEEVIITHQIGHNDLQEMALPRGRDLTIQDCPVPLTQEQVYITYCKIISSSPDLKSVFEAAKNEPWNSHLKCAMTFTADPSAWPLQALDGVQLDAHQFMLYLRLGDTYDFSNQSNWPEGKLENLMVRTGAYTDRFLLNCNSDKLRSDVGFSYWYYLLCEVPRFYDDDRKAAFYGSLLNNEHSSDPRFLRGLGVMAPHVYQNYMIDAVSEMVAATEGNQVVQDVLLSTAMLTRALAASKMTIDQVLAMGLHPKVTQKFSQNQGEWLADVCRDLMAVPPTEFSRSDLTAISTVLSLNLPHQDMSSVDIPGLTRHLLAGFEAQKDNYVERPPFRAELADTIKFLASRHEYSQDFMDELPDIGLEAFAMAGVNVHSRLSLSSRASVFRFELGV